MRINTIKLKTAIEEACDKHLEGIAQMYFISSDGEAALSHLKNQFAETEAKRTVALNMLEGLK